MAPQKPNFIISGLSRNPNPITLSRVVGTAAHGPFGEMAYPALEVAYLLRATKHLTYAGGPRLMEHTLLTGNAGIGKSTLMKNFFVDACGAYTTNPPDRIPRPRYYDGSSGDGWEFCRGSFTALGQPIIPVFVDYDFFFVSELNEWLGSGPERKDRIMRMNKVTEEGDLSVGLLKSLNVDLETRVEYSRNIRSPHVEYDPHTGRMTYRNRCAFFMCSTPQKEKKEFHEWRDNGFISRIYEIEFLPSEEEAISHGRKPFGKADAKTLLEINLAAWATPFEAIQMPPEDMLQAGRDWLVDECISVAKSSQVSFSDVFNARAHLTMAHGMTASAIARELSQRNLSDRSPIRLTYTDADLAFAKEYVSPWLNSQTIHSSDESVMERIGGADKGAVATAITFLKQAISAMAADEDPRTHRKAEFVDWCVKRNGLAVGTVNNYLTSLRKARCLKKGRYGSQTIEFEAAFLDANGLRSEPDEDGPPQDTGDE